MKTLHGHKITEKPFRVISIDPGSGKAGYSVIEYDFNKGTVKVLFSTTMSGNALSSLYFEKWFSELHGERLVRNMAHGLFLSGLLATYKPDVVACEAAYAGKFIAAFKSLTEHVTLLKAASYNYDRYLEFGMIEPSRVKAAMGVSGKSGDKNLMTKALEKRAEVSYTDGIKIAKLDEHAIDSICIGITACLDVHGKLTPKKKKAGKKKK